MRAMASAAKFVEVWQSANSPGEVAKRLGMSLASVQRRSVRLRAVGVNLKYFLPRIDVAALNDIVERAGA